MNKERDYLLDIIKAAGICFVFIWHVQPFKFILLENHWSYFLLKTAVERFNVGVTLIGVPVFFTVSLYLFYKKQNIDAQYFIKRIIRLIKLYLFWVGVQLVIYYLVYKKMPSFSFQLIKAGGPGLPVVGGSVFYFLYDLFFFTVFAFLFTKCSSRAKTIISITIFVLSVVIFEAAIFTDKLPQDFYNLWCFFYIVPLTYLLSTRQDLFIKHKYKILAGYFLFVLHDTVVLYLAQQFALQFRPYARISIIFGTLTLFVFIIDSRLGSGRIISLLSMYSLGIFALHKYFQLLSYIITTDYGYICLLGTGIEIRPLVIFLTTALLTLSCLYLMRKICLRQYISESGLWFRAF